MPINVSSRHATRGLLQLYRGDPVARSSFGRRPQTTDKWFVKLFAFHAGGSIALRPAASSPQPCPAAASRQSQRERLFFSDKTGKGDEPSGCTVPSSQGVMPWP